MAVLCLLRYKGCAPIRVFRCFEKNRANEVTFPEQLTMQRNLLTGAALWQAFARLTGSLRFRADSNGICLQQICD